MKNIFVESYTPYVIGGHLLKDENEIAWPATLLWASAAIIIAVSVLNMPATLLFLTSLIPHVSIVGVVLLDYDADALRPIRKKRGPEVLTRDWSTDSWYDLEAAIDYPLYKEKLLEYLEFLRHGGAQNFAVEQHLYEWLKESKKIAELEEKRRAQGVAAMLIDTDQLKAYRQAIDDIKLNH